MAKLSLFILVVLFSLAVHANKSYDGYVLIEAVPRNAHDHQMVDYLQEMDPELDFWLESPSAYHIFVPQEKQEFVIDFLTRNGVSIRIINDHVQRDIEEEMTRLLRKRSFSYNDFNTYSGIATELGNLAVRCRSDLGVNGEVFSAGQSVEGRDLWVLKISKAGSNRKAVWIDATIHAREWLATATHLKIAKHLVDDYATDAEVKKLVDKYDFYLLPVVNPDGYDYTWNGVKVRLLYLLPVVNPDGYDYTWNGERLWRKNRSVNSGSTCRGVDLNRNFDQKWRNAGTSTLACSETYGGQSAGSEPETQALQSAAVKYGPTLATSIHIHTYGQYWLIPWGSYAANGRTCNYADDDAEMMSVANKVADAIQNTYKTKWLRGNSCATIYPASGLTMDYFKDVGGVKYTATPELRGPSFIVSASQIEPSYTELWNGLRVLFEELENK